MMNRVVLVHGFGDKAARMKYINNYLHRSGRIVYSVSLSPSWGQIGIDELADQLNEFVKNNIPPDQKFDLIGFSMGGLISRYYIQRLGGLARIEHFITISTPHRGTRMASLICNRAARQMRMKSKFLNDLNSDIEMLSCLKVTSIWTPFDLMIVPPSSSHITIGDEIKIGSLLHPLMVRNKKCMQALEKALVK